MIGLGNLIHYKKVTAPILSPYQTFIPMTVNKEFQKPNGSIFTVENGVKANKSELATNEDATSQCSSKDNVFRDSNCYFLYLFGKAWQTTLEKLPSSLKCCCKFEIVCI